MENKAQNYTAEQVQLMVEQYKQGTSVEQIAEALGKSTRSIVAKLSREGVYVAKTSTGHQRMCSAAQSTSCSGYPLSISHCCIGTWRFQILGKPYRQPLGGSIHIFIVVSLEVLKSYLLLVLLVD